MKILKFRNLHKLVLAVSILLIFSSSCKKENETSSDYVGIWIAVESIPTDTGFSSIKDIMTFSEDRFTDLIQMPDESVDKWIDFASMKGSISVSGNLMTVTIAELGISSFNFITGKPTGAIISYKAGSAEFDALLSQAEQSTTFKSEYSVSGNKMTLKTDNNNDGDYLDEDEVTVYTKQ